MHRICHHRFAPALRRLFLLVKSLHYFGLGHVLGPHFAVPKPEVKHDRLPTKWRTAVDLFAEELQQWNAAATQNGGSTSSSVFLDDAKARFPNLPKEKREAFETAAEGVSHLTPPWENVGTGIDVFAQDSASSMCHSSI